ncbi:MAG: GerW family sporulation protein [Defluviitaleaceae bacterium]|nr:GerW family sporulation protein [Defluviitaleaceae bacterium]
MKELNPGLEKLFSKMENFINSKTVIGEPMQIGDTTIVPLIDVFFGVGASSKDKEREKKGTSDSGGLGAKITPSAILVIKNDNVQLVNMKDKDSLNKIIDMLPGIFSKLQEKFGKKDKEDIAKEVMEKLKEESEKEKTED